MIIIIIIIIIITFKGAIGDFLQSPHCAANRLQHVRSSGPGAIMCKSRATHRVRATWQEGTAHLFSLTELKSHLSSFILLAEPLTDAGGEETGVPGEIPWRRASENATY